MRVAVQAESVVPGLSAGIEHFTSGLLRGLDNVVTPNDEIIAVVARGTERDWRDAVGQARALRLVEVASTASLAHLRQRSSRFPPLRRTIDWLAYSPATRPLLAMIRRGVSRRSLARLEPDVVYYPHRPTHGVAGSSVLTVHHLPKGPGRVQGEGESRMVAAGIADATAIVTSWPHPYGDILNSFPDVADRLFLVPFPVMSGPLDSRSPGRDDPFILYPATVAPHKNHRMLLEAIARLRETRDVKLVCTGTRLSPFVDELELLATRLGIGAAVEFRGFVSPEQLDELYRTASAVVVPSLWEAASGPVFEAFAYGKPVACSDVPPIRSQIEWAHGAAAFFDPLDADSIATTIFDVLEDPEPFRERGKKAARFMEQFTWERTAADYLRVFQWVAEGADRDRRPTLSSPPPGGLRPTGGVQERARPIM